MTAEITKSVLLPHTLALPPHLASIIALLVALPGDRIVSKASPSCLASHRFTGRSRSSGCSVEVVGFTPLLLSGGCWVLGRALGSHWRHWKAAELQPAVKYQQSTLCLVPDYAFNYIAKHIFSSSSSGHFFFFGNRSSEVQSHCYSHTTWLLFSLPVLIMCPPLLLLQAGGFWDS